MLRHYRRAALFLSSATAVGGGFTSHKYDCFNIGPCKGDVDFWITLDGLATYSFLGFWLVLLALTAVHARSLCEARPKILAWSTAFLVPSVAAFVGAWFFNLGVKVPAI